MSHTLWQGHISNGSFGDYSMADAMTEVMGMMASYGNVQPDGKTYALQVEGCLKSQELEVRHHSSCQ